MRQVYTGPGIDSSVQFDSAIAASNKKEQVIFHAHPERYSDGGIYPCTDFSLVPNLDNCWHKNFPEEGDDNE